MKHEITYESIGENEQTVGRYPNRGTKLLPQWEVVCTCGWKEDNRGHGYVSNADGTVSKHVRTIGWNHIVAVTDPSNSKGAPMELVGQIIKKRVTNEIWIASKNGEMPDEITKGFWRTNRGNAIWPWVVIRKHSRGMNVEAGPFQIKEYAYAAAIDMLHNGYIDGFDIDIAAEVNMDTVEIPFGTIDTYFKRLSDRAKTAEKPEDLVKLHEKIEKALAVTTMLESARDTIQNKLLFNE